MDSEEPFLCRALQFRKPCFINDGISWISSCCSSISVPSQVPLRSYSVTAIMLSPMSASGRVLECSRACVVSLPLQSGTRSRLRTATQAASTVSWSFSVVMAGDLRTSLRWQTLSCSVFLCVTHTPRPSNLMPQQLYFE